MEKKIIQISDVHFGALTFSEELKSNLISQIQHENPDFIIFAGDATDHGYETEYNDASVFVDELKATSEVHSIPGNHDARNVGILHFQRLIGERNFIRIDKKAGFVIIGLDSSQADVNSGDIGYDQMKWLRDELKKIPDDLGKFVTFHHHLLPVPQAGRERNILLDSGDLIQELVNYKVNFVLNGHKHVHNTWTMENMVVLNSGTATTGKLRGDTRPCYNQMIIGEEGVDVYLVITETGQKQHLAKYSVELKDEEFTICSHKHKSG